MVSIAVSKMGMTVLMFVDPGMKVRDTIKLLQQETLDFNGLISGHQTAQT